MQRDFKGLGFGVRGLLRVGPTGDAMRACGAFIDGPVRPPAGGRGPVRGWRGLYGAL